MNIEFACANCGANLKVLQTFAGKTIQCPKCTKKTPVPALSTPPAKAPAAPVDAVPSPARSASTSEPKPTVMDGVYISFPCGNCGAGLKLVKSLAGKMILCPKCAKKTLVPGGAPPPAPAAPESPASAPEPSPASVAAAPSDTPPASSPATPPPKPPARPPVTLPQTDDSLQPRLREQDAKLEVLTRQMQDMELRLEVARLKTEKAEQEKNALLTQKATDKLRLQEELSTHFQAELEAARKTITGLEGRVREATERRLASPAASGGRTAAQIEKELLENPDDALTEAETAVPDAVMAAITQSRFSRYIRTSIVIHAIIMGLTSVGTIKGYFIKEPVPAEAGDSATNAVPIKAVSPSAVDTAAVKPAAAEPAAAAVPPGGAEPATLPPKSTEEKKMEALPAPGEKPPSDTQVNLGL
jgi:DNA-directed RNA polymerase subunit RPC12/RpoP